MQLTVHEAIAGVDPEAWNALTGDAYPFLRHEFLLAAEQTGCVSEDAGWAPRHLTIQREGKLLGAMPLYQKEHSWGEFVFDWAWARAYEQAGLSYYPKLVSAIPFTPAPSRRLLLADRTDEAAARALVDGAIMLAGRTECSSLHVLFPLDDELPLFRKAGLQVRKDCQFHWHNRGYADFDQFLGTFTASKRKKARRDRRRVSEAGIRFRRLKGADLDVPTWELVYRLISLTFMRRGSLPYYNLDFFLRIGAALPDNVLVILAEQHGELAGGCLGLQGRGIEEHDQHAGPLHVPEEPEAEAGPTVGALDDAGDVGRHERVVAHLHHPEDRGESGEGVVRHLRAGAGDLANKAGLARIRETE